MLDRLADMDDKLDRIQKSLDEYLETKRQVTRSLGIGVRVRGRIRRAWTSTWRPSARRGPTPTPSPSPGPNPNPNPNPNP